MAINVNTLAPASLKSKNVATEQYVDSSISSIDVSGDINANNNALAIAQGFSSYSDMASKYSALGKSIINGGYINAGLVSADSIAVNSISADRLMAGTSGSTVWSNGGLVSSNFNGNVSGNIGTPTSGFRLSSGAAGNTNDPNIYGAYIKGSIIEGITLNTSDIKVKAEGYPNNFGRVNYVTNGGDIVMPGYNTGFWQNRVCSSSQSFVKLEGWHRGATNSLTANLEYSTDNVTWHTLSSKNSQAYGYQEAFIIYFAERFPLGLVSLNSRVFFRITGNGDYATSSPVLVTIYNN